MGPRHEERRRFYGKSDLLFHVGWTSVERLSFAHWDYLSQEAMVF